MMTSKTRASLAFVADHKFETEILRMNMTLSLGRNLYQRFKSYSKVQCLDASFLAEGLKGCSSSFMCMSHTPQSANLEASLPEPSMDRLWDIKGIELIREQLSECLCHMYQAALRDLLHMTTIVY